MLDINKPFCLFANCNVLYEGRASSILKDGNYLVIYKSDRSVQIHGATRIQPRNYQSANSVIDLHGNVLSFSNKKEKLLITINDIMFVSYLKELSNYEIEITRTEEDLVNKLFNNLSHYIDKEFAIIEREYQTGHGPVDLAGFTNDGETHLIEVKRGRATLTNCTQLKKYIEAAGGNVFGHLASPSICSNAMTYLEKHSMNWIYVDF